MQQSRQLKKRKPTRTMDSVRLHDANAWNLYILHANLNRFDFVVVSVPSENKRDMRTIEDVQADIQAKKKMKLSQTTVTTVDQQPKVEPIESTTN